jgi:hypothetical protein
LHFPKTSISQRRKSIMNTESSKGYTAPGTHFNLEGWKLQIPGPKEVTIPDLDMYASEYFFLNSAKQMCFWIDCADTRHTPNSEYVRSELRHLKNWHINDTAQLSAKIKVDSKANPNKVTVLQIHGIKDGVKDSEDNAPPLLRIALNDGSLRAIIKIDNSFGDEDPHSVENIELGSLDSNSGEINCAIEVHKEHLIISTDGVEKLNRDLSFWKYKNYFKAGCYPQSHHGTVTVMFSKLSVKT